MGYRVAHNAAATYIARQRRKKLHKLATLEDFAATSSTPVMEGASAERTAVKTNPFSASHTP